MLRVVVVLIMCLSSTATFAQSDRDIMNDAIELIERLMADNELIFERLRTLEQQQQQLGGASNAPAANGGSAQISETFSISDASEKSKRLGRHDYCALTQSGEVCVCIVEHQASGEFILKKEEHNFGYCRCSATCFNSQ